MKTLSPRVRLLTMVMALGLAAPVAVRACPFCNAQQKTLSEELDSSDVAVIAKLVKGPGKEAIAAGNADAESTFEVVQTIKGPDNLPKQIRVLYFGQPRDGNQFLVFGADPKKTQWAAPNVVSPRAAKYVAQLTKLPKKGADRLAFFQEYLEDEESLLATDAYDEFARAPYAEVKALKEQMHHERLLAWIKDPEVPASRRRLYLTMLGVCGEPGDVAVLEGMIKSTDRHARLALDAMVACYLIIKGPDGMPLVEDLFLKNKEAEYTDTYATIMALRFLGQETTAVPKARLLEGLRAMLDRPHLADLVIPDLARWQDWSAMEKLVELFKHADEESAWVKVPVVNYLRVCPQPEAKKYLAELEKLDPESVKRANTYSFGGIAAPAQPAGKGAKQPLVPAPDKPAAKPDTSGKAGKSSAEPAKGPKPGQSSAREAMPMVPALIGAVVAAAEDSSGVPEKQAEEPRPARAKSNTALAEDNAALAERSATASQSSVGRQEKTSTRLSGLAGSASATRSTPPPANRWRVASVTLAAAAGVLGLIVTILKGN